MTENKTKKTNKSVAQFLDSIEDPQKQADSKVINDMMKKITKAEPKMWGDSIIGFGDYHYKYESGREGDWFHVGFSPRKQNITLYLVYGFEKYEELMKKLGKYKTGKACLYINKLTDIDIRVLKQLMEESFKAILKRKV